MAKKSTIDNLVDLIFPPKIATQYDYESHSHPGTDFTIPKDLKDPTSHPSFSMTNQDDQTTNINDMMARYEKTGLITDLITGQRRQPVYGDFTEVGDYHTMQIKMARVSQAFDLLPAKVRARFENDPAKIIEFLADLKNDQEAISLGLKPKAEPKVAESSTLDPEAVAKANKVHALHGNLDPKKNKKPADAGGDPAEGGE